MQKRDSILIVDDQDDVRLLIRMILATKDYELHEARDGPSALQKIKHHAPELILLDVMMPGNPNGLELLHIIKRDPSVTTKIVMISAKGQATDVLEARMIGSDGYIVKPFTQQQLLDTVGNVLNHRN